MLKCKQASHLMSQAQDRELSLAERWRLKFHLVMCSGCSQYNKQMNFIRLAMKEFKDR